MKKIGLLALCGVVAGSAVGCGDDGDRPRDAGCDPATMICLDSGSDPDAGPIPDAGPDTGRPDAGGACDVGEACDPGRGCRRSPLCIDQGAGTVGTAADPITGHPDGVTTVDTISWLNGYCTTAGPVETAGCDLDSPDTSCGSCGICLNAGRDAAGTQYSLCALKCTPSMTENTCRDGYDCALGNDACLPGCSTDDECAVYRADTNGDGTIDDGPTGGGVDALVYDTDGNWRCNTTTDRCEHDGTTGAQAGDVCVKDTDCEAMGRCLDEAGTDGGWPEGYCFKLGCDVPGNECAGDGVCDDRAFGLSVCLQGCTVAETDPAGDMFAPSADCRGGYACFWDGTSGASAPVNGVCIPGNYNDVTDPNVGDPCTDESTCYSPFGLGQCRDWDGPDEPGPSVCTMFDCSAPGMPAGVCGAGATCTGVSGSSTTLCLAACTSGDDCAAHYGCYPGNLVGLTVTTNVCFAGCVAGVENACKTGERCDQPDTTMLGTCVPAT